VRFGRDLPCPEQSKGGIDMLPEKGHLLRIFISENDKHDGIPLYEWIVRKAKTENLAGATVIRGLEGFGAHHHIHTSKILRLADDLPIIVEIVDTLEKIDAFIPLIDDVIEEGMATVEDVQIRFYKSRKTPDSIKDKGGK